MDPTASAANTHVLAHAGRIWALEEGHLPYELTPELDTVGCDDFGGRLTTAFTAHPKLCPETGELHFFGYGVLPPFLTYHVLDAAGALVHSAPITVPGPTMMHDFMITRDHADLHGPARRVRPRRGDARRRPAALGRVLRRPRSASCRRFGTDADVRWFDVDPCYVFHPLNAYVDGVDASSATSGATTGCGGRRWTTSRRRTCTAGRSTSTRGAVTEERLDDVSHAFPARRRPRRRPAPPLRLGDRAPRPATGRRSATPRSSSSTTSRPDRASATTSARTPTRASSCSCVPTTRPARTRAGRSASSTTTPRTAPTSSCSTRRTPPPSRSPACTCRAACPTGSTAAGSPTPSCPRLKTRSVRIPVAQCDQDPDRDRSVRIGERLRPRTSPGRGCRTPSRGR